jgi:hypothetical protein
MPYIAASSRIKLDKTIDPLIDSIIAEAVDSGDELNAVGLLNYSITRMILTVFRRLFPRKYWNYPLAKGLLVDIGDELQDRSQRKYEDGKKEKNGDLAEFEEF